MCKVLIIPAIKESKRRQTEDFIMVMSEAMSKHNSDGLGYAAIDAQGNLFGQRWFHNGMAFSKPVSLTKEEFTARQAAARSITDKWGKNLKATRYFAAEHLPASSSYNEFGDTPDLAKASAITLHTRMATCDRNLGNVHPFVDQDTSVIHNGIISNSKDFDLKLSTCDSESILISYLKNNVNVDPAGIIHQDQGAQGMSNSLLGYYAAASFSRDALGNRILDIYKMNNNNLSICWIYDLDTYVLSTSDNDIKDACKVLGFTHDGTIDLHDGYLTRLNPFTGEVLEQVEFTKPVEKPKPSLSDHFWRQTSHHNKSNAQATNVLPYKGKGKQDNKAVIDAASFRMMQLTSSIEEFSVREVEEFQAASGLWD